MSEYAMKSIREKLCRELDEVARKPDLGAGDLDILHKITDTVKNIDKIEMLEEIAAEDRSQVADYLAQRWQELERANAALADFDARGAA